MVEKRESVDLRKGRHDEGDLVRTEVASIEAHDNRRKVVKKTASPTGGHRVGHQ